MDAKEVVVREIAFVTDGLIVLLLRNITSERLETILKAVSNVDSDRLDPNPLQSTGRKDRGRRTTTSTQISTIFRIQTALYKLVCNKYPFALNHSPFLVDYEATQRQHSIASLSTRHTHHQGLILSVFIN